MRILGIDPGSRISGWAIIETQNKSEIYIAGGIIKLGDYDEVEKLGKLFNFISELIQTYNPKHLALERTFLAKNVNSTIKLAEARAAVMVAATINEVQVFEYAPKEVKLLVTGFGSASKEAMQTSVKRHFDLSGEISSDAADALGISLAHSVKSRNPLFSLSDKKKSNLTARKTSWRNFNPDSFKC